MSELFDFIAIGDIVIDAFIRLKSDEAKVACDAGGEHCQISMAFGEKIPYESVTICPAVGNSPNAAVSAARLGLRSALISDIGRDQNGRDCLNSLSTDKIETNFVTAHEEMKTNYHYVLWYGDDRTILIKHEDYPYKLPTIDPPRWVYISSLGEHSLPYHQEIIAWIKKNPEIKVAFQPGTFQIRFGTEALGPLYRRTEIFFCNKGEAQQILKTTSDEVKELAKRVALLGPKIVIITDGHNGAHAWDGTDLWQMPIYPDPKPPFDRTGAGDAFSSTVVSALALGKTLPEALSWGPINSMSVVQKTGAQAGLLSRTDLEKYLSEAPENYQVHKIN